MTACNLSYKIILENPARAGANAEYAPKALPPPQNGSMQSICPKGTRLLGVQLNDEVFFNRIVDIVSLRKSYNLAAEEIFVLFKPLGSEG